MKRLHFLDQPLASRFENVNPFNVVTFRGNITLNPGSDIWTRNVILDNGNRSVFGDTEGSVTTQFLVSSEPEKHMRSRNVEFEATTLKPNTRYYPFFDSTSGIDIIPKLIEIEYGIWIFPDRRKSICSFQQTNSGDFGPTIIGRFRISTT